ncbi:MAG: hypothetical protein COA66_05110 [Arcobacter sp.]|nr:MAG: hypothetical protein COA66_05110 [Arcobacter sp.]
MQKKIVLIVGASGVGKDTLLKNIKKSLKNKANFITRYITREADLNEKNYFLDPLAFDLLKINKFFVSSWAAHNNFYGISKNSIKEGLNIISISRSSIKDFEAFYDNVYTINITVPKEELRKRLIKRARENKDEIEERLNRSYACIESNNLIHFDNSEDIGTSSESLLNLLSQIKEEK